MSPPAPGTTQRAPGTFVRYEEVQRFHPVFEAFIVLLALFVGVCLVSDVGFHRPVGTHPAPTPVLAGMLVLFALLYLLLFRLVVRVGREDVHVIFGYLGVIAFRWRGEQIHSCRPVTYRPLGEFGGWGIRFGSGGRRCYSARGNQGVLLETERHPVIIGSQQPEKLAAAIQDLLAGGS